MQPGCAEWAYRKIRYSPDATHTNDATSAAHIRRNSFEICS
jgi:hypothetical protein